MQLKLNMGYKEYIQNKELKSKLDILANNLANLQLDYDGDKQKIGEVITSAQVKQILEVLPLFIPATELEKFDKLSNNKKRKVLASGVFGAYKNKLVFDRGSLSKKVEDKIYTSEKYIASYNLMREIYTAMITKVTIDKATGEIKIF